MKFTNPLAVHLPTNVQDMSDAELEAIIRSTQAKRDKFGLPFTALTWTIIGLALTNLLPLPGNVHAVLITIMLILFVPHTTVFIIVDRLSAYILALLDVLITRSSKRMIDARKEYMEALNGQAK